MGYIGCYWQAGFVDLWEVIGLHAHVNAPTLLFASSGIPPMVMLAVVTLALLVWPQLATVRAIRWVKGRALTQPAPTRRLRLPVERCAIRLTNSLEGDQRPDLASVEGMALDCLKRH